jgi:hypothetical protein
MKVKILLLLSLVTAFNVIACPGKQKIKLNDVKELTAYSVRDTKLKKDYMFNDDLEGRSWGLTYSISNSSGYKTHNITLIPMSGNRISVVVYNIVDNFGRTFIGQYDRKRGCNDIVEVLPEDMEE